jgi:purine-cytosine permease-like protein
MDSIKIISILSIALQFISFWLAAPEVLGSEWLKKTESLIRKGILAIPNIVLSVLGVIVGYSFMEGLENLNYYILVPAILMLILSVVFAKKIKKILDLNITVPILKKLIINDSFRFTLLKTAAMLFTLGFVLQIITIIYQ